MSPLQRIAMGLVIVLVPAYFPRDPHPAWAFYDALPDPVGWLLVLVGVRALRGHLDVDLLTWLAWVALVVSVPLWLPQVNHLLVPEYNSGIDVSFQWFLSLPQTVFSLVLARTIGRAAERQVPRDRFVAGRYGVLTWAFAALRVVHSAIQCGANKVMHRFYAYLSGAVALWALWGLLAFRLLWH